MKKFFKTFSTLIFIASLILLVFADVVYFGENSNGDTTITIGNNYIIMGRFQNTAGNGNVTELGVNLNFAQAGHTRIGIYNDNAGEPGTLLVDAGVITNPSVGWNTISALSTAVTSGTYYWLVLLNDIEETPNCKTVVNTLAGYASQAYGALPSPCPTRTAYTKAPCMRAGVTLSGGGWTNMPATLHGVLWMPIHYMEPDVKR